MAFVIHVKNEGPTAHIVIRQEIDLGEPPILFSAVIETDTTADVTAYTTEAGGDDRGIFIWYYEPHTFDYKKDVWAGETMTIP